MPTPRQRPHLSRHRWLKLRIHVYVCMTCGCGRVNDNDHGDWQTTFHMSDGKSDVLVHVPPCEVGPRTAAVLAKYEAEIVSATPVKAPRAARTRVRSTDPDTSQLAAENVAERISEVQGMVLDVLRDFGAPVSDPVWMQGFRVMFPDYQVSDSGLRTRRAELVDQGFVEDSEQRVADGSSKFICWRVVAKAGRVLICRYCGGDVSDCDCDFRRLQEPT